MGCHLFWGGHKPNTDAWSGEAAYKSGQDMEKKIIKLGQMNGYESNNRVYSGGGISPCINSRDYKDAVKVIKKSCNGKRLNTLRCYW